jgi:hypothetical protein
MNNTVDIRSAIANVSKGHPGALRVCCELWDHLGEPVMIDFALMVEKGIVGSDVWYLFNDCCNRDIAATHASVMDGTAVTKLESALGSSFYKEAKRDAQ